MTPVIIAGLMLPVSAIHAEDMYFGVKAGPMLTDVSGLDNSTNVGFNIGFPVIKDRFTIEGELTTAISKGDAGFNGAEWDVLTLAGYAVYRTRSKTYFKAKAGLLYEDVSIDTGGGFQRNVSATDTGLSVGVGVGHKLQSGHKIELELTIIEADITFVSLGYLF